MRKPEFSPSTSDTSAETPAPPDEIRLVRRRLLFLGGTVAAAGVAGVASAQSANAVSATTAWQAGGNANINSDGTNFLGPTNSVPLIFKTTPSAGTPTERMRINATGRVGIGTNAPSMPLDVKGSTASVVRATSTSTSDTSAGVNGVNPIGIGVVGTSTSNTGVQGGGAFCGVRGTGGSYGGIFDGTSYGATANGGATGLYASGTGYGVFADGGSGYGVYALGLIGIRGASSDPNNASILGDGGQYGVLGVNGRTAGVRGDSGYVGVWGHGTAYGLYGTADGAGGYGVMGAATGSAAWGLYSIGNCGVQGTLSKSAGSFKIDHPLAPEKKWLYHSFVESPDMMNVYNGVAVLDAAGEATVTMPDYFESLNRDFRYQLTAVGGAAPSLHIKSEVSGNQFVVAGGAPGLKVSWQVTGIRQDAYAKEHPIVVEEDKVGTEQGTLMFVPKGSSAKAFVPFSAAPVAHSVPPRG